MTAWNNKKTDNLANALIGVDSIPKMKNFLRDLLTEQEIIEFGNRLEAARMLFEGIPYSVIVKKTGLSSTTVARISKWLFSGMGGYQSIFKNLQHSHLKKSGLKTRTNHATHRP